MSIIQFLLEPYSTYSPIQIILEVFAASFGLISVYFSIKKNILVYPTGIISTALYVYILFKFGLLGDCLVNVYYTIMSVYGWVLWSKNREDNLHVEVLHTTKKEWRYAALLFIFSALIVTTIYYFKPYLDNNFSLVGTDLGLYHLSFSNYLDIITTSVFLVGMWLMAKRKVENWIFWIIGDFICIPMMLFKGLAITSAQYLVFTIMAVIGYRTWSQINNNK